MGAERSESRLDRWVDIASVALISIAAVLTAYCSYESARWTGLQTMLYNEVDTQRIAASIASNRANTFTTIDVATFLRYVAASAEGRTTEAAFMRRRFRPEMRRAMDAWLGTKPLKNQNAPPTPFSMRQYQLETNKEAARLSREAGLSFESAKDAEAHAEWYVRLTVIFASVSFLAGISTKFRSPSCLYLVAVGFGVLIFGLIRMLEQPFL